MSFLHARHSTRRIAAATATLLSALVLTGCNQTTQSTANKVSAAAVPPPATPEAPTMGYWEHEHDGRIYVIGNEATNAAFLESHHLPYTFTKIGAGPKGETVVVEAGKSGSELQNALWEKFSLRNLYYAEEEHDGRIYVLGSAKSHLGFRSNPHLPLALTLIGAGVDGKTVVFEVAKDNDAQAPRLKAEYAARHGIVFPL